MAFRWGWKSIPGIWRWGVFLLGDEPLSLYTLLQARAAPTSAYSRRHDKYFRRCIYDILDLINTTISRWLLDMLSRGSAYL